MSDIPGSNSACGTDIATVSATTHVDSSQASLKWDIQNIKMVFPNKTEIGILLPEHGQEFYSTFESVLKSPIFVTNLGSSKTKKCEQKWFVQLSAANISDSNAVKNYISFYLCREDLPSDSEEVVLDERPSRLYLSVYILGEGNVEYPRISTGTLSTIVIPNGGGWGSSKFISLESLWKKRNIYLVNKNVLRIRVQLTVFGYPVTESGAHECVTYVARNKLMNDMRELLESGRDSDITFICGDREILAHATILKGRCHVFERMLETCMTESTTKTIKIEDVDPIVFETFLEYIYTAEVELSVENLGVLFGLVRVADKYGVEELKAICFKYICQHISDEHAGEIAVLSLEHNAGDNLRSQVVAFCRSNWSKLSQLEAFKAYVLENPLAFFD